MKKILLIFVLIINVFFISSCGLKLDGDGQIARNNILKLVNYIENEEKEQIIELFSPIKKKEITNLHSQVDGLCDYYLGTYESISANGLGAYEPIDYGKSVKYYEMFYDIHTSNSNYHFSVLWYIKDDYNIDNIGIWSLFVEKFDGEAPQTPIVVWNDGITLL